MRVQGQSYDCLDVPMGLWATESMRPIDVAVLYDIGPRRYRHSESAFQMLEAPPLCTGA